MAAPLKKSTPTKYAVSVSVITDALMPKRAVRDLVQSVLDELPGETFGDKSVVAARVVGTIDQA